MLKNVCTTQHVQYSIGVCGKFAFTRLSFFFFYVRFTASSANEFGVFHELAIVLEVTEGCSSASSLITNISSRVGFSGLIELVISVGQVCE
jgi:hypothetical protein